MRRVLLICYGILLSTMLFADFIYTSVEGGIAITGYEGEYPSDLVIPAKIEDQPVVLIGEEAFSHLKEILTVTFGKDCMP